MAYKDFIKQYRSGSNPITGEPNLYKELTDQTIWDAAQAEIRQLLDIEHRCRVAAEKVIQHMLESGMSVVMTIPELHDEFNKLTAERDQYKVALIDIIKKQISKCPECHLQCTGLMDVCIAMKYKDLIDLNKIKEG